MISGTFHPLAQEWRYFSREKSIVHTLHLAQLPASHAGDTVLIASTPPVTRQTGGGRGAPPMQLPSAPFYGLNAYMITNQSLQIDCYGSTTSKVTEGVTRISAQSKMQITIGAIGGAASIITMTPEEPGYFVVHVEATSDLHTLGYQGVADDGQITLQIFKGAVGGTLLNQQIFRLHMEGTSWNAGQYVDSMLRCHVETLALLQGESVIGYGINLGNPPVASMNMWCMKVADL